MLWELDKMIVGWFNVIENMKGFTFCHFTHSIPNMAAMLAYDPAVMRYLCFCIYTQVVECFSCDWTGAHCDLVSTDKTSISSDHEIAIICSFVCFQIPLNLPCSVTLQPGPEDTGKVKMFTLLVLHSQLICLSPNRRISDEKWFSWCCVSSGLRSWLRGESFLCRKSWRKDPQKVKVSSSTPDTLKIWVVH